MKISLKWLSKFVEIPEDVTPQKIGELFTVRTAEVEGVIEEGKAFENMVLGLVKEVKPHPNADKLRIAMTDVGDKTVQIVCGGVNLAQGMKVAIALPGARVKWHGEGDLVTLEHTKIRGEESIGMICAGEEIGLPAGGEHEILDLKTDAKPGTPLAEVLGKNDIILEIDNKSLTHRPDLWGHYGIAREISAIFGTKLKPYEKAVKLAKDSDFTDKELVKIKIEDPEICHRFTACVVTEIKIQESPDWLKRDLIAVGIRPVNNVVDVTNHLMLGLGQPMHAFDRTAVGSSLMIRRAKQGEQFETLDHKMRTLASEDVVICNDEQILALAGIMGGKKSEINSETTEIIFEAATWNSTLIRRTSTRHTLRTDAVQRFEKALDPEMTEVAIRRACALLKQICPSAKIASKLIDIRNQKPKKITLSVSTDVINKKIGTDIKPAEMAEILKKLQFKVQSPRRGKKSGSNLQIEVPSFRATKDISIQEDIAEEIARMYGYEKLPVIMPELHVKLPHENIDRQLKHKARDIFSLGLGFSEVYNYSFYSQSDLQKALLADKSHLKLLNFLSTDQTHMRISLVPNILKNIASNLRFFDEFKIYEIGRTYTEVHEYFPQEEKWICGAVVSSDENNFYEAKGAVEKFLNRFGSKAYETTENISYAPYAHPKKYLGYLYEGEANAKRERAASEESGSASPERREPIMNEFARVFEIHPIVARNFDLGKTKVALFEINLNRIIAYGIQEKKYQPIPKFPGINIDVSVLINKNKKISDLQTLINVNELVQEVELIDLYEGKNIEEGKKSVTFRIHLLAPDRTLTDEEMKKTQEKIFEELQRMGGSIRGL